MRSRGRTRSRLVLTCLVLSCAGLLAACGPKAAATVNGVQIMQSQIDSQIATMKQQHPTIFEGANGQQLESQFRKRILDTLVTNVLVVQEAKAQGVTASDTEVATRLQAMMAGYPSSAAFSAALKKMGSSLEELKQRTSTQILTQKMVDKITAGVKVTDAEALDYYRANKELFGGQPKVHVLMIKIAMSDSAKAKALAARLKAGASFATAAKLDSTDLASKKAGGDLGLKPLNELPADIAGAVRVAPIGAVVGPFQGMAGLYIIKVLRREAPAQQPFNQVKKTIKTIVKQEKQVKAYNDWIQSLKKKANLTGS